VIVRLLISLALLAAAAMIPAPLSLAEEKQGGPTEHRFMEGTEIQGTLEKPHAVYVIPWGDIPESGPGHYSIRRSFRNEILAPVNPEEFHHNHRRKK
jgi:hypothetical protein